MFISLIYHVQFYFNPTINCILYRKPLTRVFSKTHKKTKTFLCSIWFTIYMTKIIIPFFWKFFNFFQIFYKKNDLRTTRDHLIIRVLFLLFLYYVQTFIQTILYTEISNFFHFITFSTLFQEYFPKYKNIIFCKKVNELFKQEADTICQNNNHGNKKLD